MRLGWRPSRPLSALVFKPVPDGAPGRRSDIPTQSAKKILYAATILGQAQATKKFSSRFFDRVSLRSPCDKAASVAIPVTDSARLWPLSDSYFRRIEFSAGGGLAMTRAQLTAAQHAARHRRIAHLLRTTCSYCHAPAGEPCRSKSGTPIWEIPQMHNARLTAPPRHPIRSARLP